MSGPTKNLAAALYHQPQPLRSHAGIDYCNVDGAFGKILDRGEQSESTGTHILGRDVMSDVYKSYVFGFSLEPAEDNALHLRRVERAKVAEQRYDLHLSLRLR